MTTMQEVFEIIYRENRWKSSQSVSGTGSSLGVTGPVREGLCEVFAQFSIRSLVDAPCGDANWISEITSGLDAYTGIDIVADLIEENRRRYADRPNMSFQHGDIANLPFPHADAVLCRDCLVHLPFAAALQALHSM